MSLSDLFTKKNMESALLWGSVFFSAVFCALVAADVTRSAVSVRPSVYVPSFPERVSKKRTLPLDERLAGFSDLLRYNVAKNRGGGAGSAGTGDDQISSASPSSIVLKGVVMGESASCAVVSAGGSEEVVHLGDRIAGGRIVAVLEDRIVIEDNFRRRSEITMPFGAAAEPSGDSEEQPRSGPSITRTVSKREFLSLFDPPDRLMKDLVLSPATKNDASYGIRIVSLNPSSLMASQMGLAAGDIILSINNKPLFSPEDGMAAYQAMKSEDEILFNIDRNGVLTDLKVVFN